MSGIRVTAPDCLDLVFLFLYTCAEQPVAVRSYAAGNPSQGPLTWRTFYSLTRIQASPKLPRVVRCLVGVRTAGPLLHQGTRSLNVLKDGSPWKRLRLPTPSAPSR